jgi:hypothetical protein
MSRLYVAEIIPEWADKVSRANYKIWHYNGVEAGNVGQQVDLRLLGGLMLKNISVERTPSETGRAGHYGPVVDLAFGEPRRHVTTDWLIEAAREQDRTLLADDIEARRAWTHPEGNEEIWAIPVRGLHVYEASDAPVLVTQG